MDRKDNIYITRRNRTDASIELLNYASEIKRDDSSAKFEYRF